MLRSLLVLAAVLALGPVAAIAEDDHHDHHDDDDHHLTEVDGIRIVHPWARAAGSGADTLVFLEIVNEGDGDVLLGGATEAATTVSIVGITFADGVADTTEIGAIDIPHGEFDFDPMGLAIALDGLARDLDEGGEFELELEFRNAGHVTLHVEVEAANATAHSHAGHDHH